MPRFILSILLLVLFFTGNSQTKNFIDQPYLETTVKVDTLISPDRIYMSITVSESDTKGKISVEDLENKMAVELKSLGINIDKQLKISDLSSNFKKYFLKQKDVLKSKDFSLVVYDGYTAGKVIMSLEKIGISNISIHKTAYSKIDELSILLKTKAVSRAINQGEALLKPLNQKLGKVIFISDYNTRFSDALQGRVAGIQMNYEAGKSNKIEPLNIQFDKIKVQCEINVKFLID